MADRAMNVNVSGVRDIRLPNGRLIRNVPIGTPKEDIMRKAIAAGYATEADFGVQTSAPAPANAPAPASPNNGNVDTTPSIEQRPQDRTPEQQSWLSQAAGYATNEIYKPLADLGATVGSMAAAPAIAGLAGLGNMAISAYKGDLDMDEAANTVKEVQDMLTYRPRTDKVRNLMGAVAETVAPVAEVIEDTKSGLGDYALKQTGSPAMAAMAYTAPDAVLSLMGIGRPVSRTANTKGYRAHKMVEGRPSERDVMDFISETPVEAAAIKSGAKTGFKQLEQAKFKFSDRGLGRIQDSFNGIMSRYSVHQGQAAHATLEKAMERLRQNPTPSTFDEVYDDLTQLANRPTSDLSGVMAMKAKSALLDFMDAPRGSDFSVRASELGKLGMSPADTMKTYQNSKKLWRRTKRLEEVQNLVQRANIKALSGERTFDQALKGEIERIRLNDKEMKLFTADEIEAMDDLLRGGGSDKAAKLIGQMEFSNNKQTSIIMSALSGIGATAGAATAGTAGAATGGIGTLAMLYGLNRFGKRLSKDMTKTRAAALEKEIAAAGTDGRKLAKAYMSATPKEARNPAELAKMLTDPRIDIDIEVGKSNKFMRDAIAIARGYRTMARAEMMGSIGAGASQQLYNDLNNKEDDE